MDQNSRRDSRCPIPVEYCTCSRTLVAEVFYVAATLTNILIQIVIVESIFSAMPLATVETKEGISSQSGDDFVYRRAELVAFMTTFLWLCVRYFY